MTPNDAEWYRATVIFWVISGALVLNLFFGNVSLSKIVAFVNNQVF
jgi:hypothetical protein